ncbi:MAG: transketolase C-terminal domain-containing protein [Patescibacteria group bacterium]|nr:transketolase C-terminal domain-containing protein [Patescibacteria group bacterium]
MLNSTLNFRIFDQNVEKIPTRNGYGDALVELGEKNPEIFVLTGDLAESTRVLPFQKKFPERFVECGVAEQNMMGVAAGLALTGKVPFVSSYAVFVPGRSWDQLRVSVCYTKANVKVAGAHAGISVGADGATHQALEDLAITRVLPNLTVVVPCDYEETRKCTHAVAEMVGPCYFRFAREKTPVITTKETPFEIGKAYACTEGKDVTIAACGPLLHEALLAAHELEKEGVEAEVLNCHTLKPFDEASLIKSVAKTGCCVSVEEHQTTGGLAGAVAECLGRFNPAPLETVGMPDHFGESGEPDELLTKYGMKAKDIVAAAKKAIGRKK